MAQIKRRVSCPVCRRPWCHYWRRLRALKFAQGELEKFIFRYHVKGDWPAKPLRRAVEWTRGNGYSKRKKRKKVKK